VIRTIAAVLLVVCAAVAAVYLVKGLARTDHTADQNSALSYADREIAGGNSILIDQEAAYEARALIPANQTYHVRVGPGLRNATSLTSTYVESWFTYFLMPRRPAGDARWIICYGCDHAELGPTFDERWHDDNGISIGRLG
jgi:hypothetical protein